MASSLRRPRDCGQQCYQSWCGRAYQHRKRPWAWPEGYALFERLKASVEATTPRPRPFSRTVGQGENLPLTLERPETGFSGTFGLYPVFSARRKRAQFFLQGSSGIGEKLSSAVRNWKDISSIRRVSGYPFLNTSHCPRAFCKGPVNEHARYPSRFFMVHTLVRRWQLSRLDDLSRPSDPGYFREIAQAADRLVIPASLFLLALHVRNPSSWRLILPLTPKN